MHVFVNRWNNGSVVSATDAILSLFFENIEVSNAMTCIFRLGFSYLTTSFGMFHQGHLLVTFTIVRFSFFEDDVPSQPCAVVIGKRVCLMAEEVLMPTAICHRCTESVVETNIIKYQPFVLVL